MAVGILRAAVNCILSAGTLRAGVPTPRQTLPSAARGRQEDAVSVHLHGKAGIWGQRLFPPSPCPELCSIGATKQKQLECPLARITLWEGGEAPGRKHHGLSIWSCLRPHWKELKQRGLGGRVGRGGRGEERGEGREVGGEAESRKAEGGLPSSQHQLHEEIIVKKLCFP